MTNHAKRAGRKRGTPNAFSANYQEGLSHSNGWERQVPHRRYFQ